MEGRSLTVGKSVRQKELIMAPSLLLLALLPFITIVSPAHGDFSFRTDHRHGTRWESGAALRLVLEVPDSLTADDADAEVCLRWSWYPRELDEFCLPRGGGSSSRGGVGGGGTHASAYGSTMTTARRLPGNVTVHEVRPALSPPVGVHSVTAYVKSVVPAPHGALPLVVSTAFVVLPPTPPPLPSPLTACPRLTENSALTLRLPLALHRGNVKKGNDAAVRPPPMVVTLTDSTGPESYTAVRARDILASGIRVEVINALPHMRPLEVDELANFGKLQVSWCGWTASV